MFFLKVKTNKEDKCYDAYIDHHMRDKGGGGIYRWLEFEENVIQRNGKEVIPMFYFILLYAYFSRMRIILINLLLK